MYRGGLGYQDCGTYPCDIGVMDGISCAFNPWSTNCLQLKEKADLLRGQFSGAIAAPLPPPPIPVPAGGYATGPGPTVNADPQQTIDDLSARQLAAWQAQNQRFMDTQAAALDAVTPPPTDYTIWIALGVAGVAALALFAGGR